MSDFITRLVERTLGLCEVVQPVVTPNFGNGITKKDGSSTMPSSEEEVLDSGEETQLSEFSRAEVSSLRAKIASEPNVPNGTTVPERPMRSRNLTGSQPDSKDHVVEETDKRSKSDPLVSNQKVGEELLLQHKNPPSHGNPSGDGKAKEVISAPIETSLNIDLSEKRHTSAAKPHNAKPSPARSAESPRLTEKLQNVDEQVPSLTPLASERLIRPEISFRQEQTEPAVLDHFAEKEASPMLPAMKVTIGHIDVRAVRQQTPSPPRQRKVDPKPKLSLDDYLKQRNGGQR